MIFASPLPDKLSLIAKVKFGYDYILFQFEVLRLEKRVDNELYYLRDCPQEFSTFPVDMEPEFLPESETVPVNDLVVPIGPKPWHKRWERYTDR